MALATSGSYLELELVGGVEEGLGRGLQLIEPVLVVPVFEFVGQLAEAVHGEESGLDSRLALPEVAETDPADPFGGRGRISRDLRTG